ncbi:MAG: DNA ligase D [Asticcacaulis sp.]|uniref:DNA ligase D n=1 Tax=Asticcacaulis sp. TaxID=1872648 RepID=UPI003F7C37BF
MDQLDAYNRKRDFSRTQEPSGRTGKAGTFQYLIQKHDATRLHYDFRLELDGVLKSWAVTKGPSLDPADKRLAVEVEDHPVAYGGFEGTIPKGQYGGGTVMLWDRGTWEPVGDPHEGLRKGDLKFRLHGERLQGEWVLVRMKPRGKDKDRGRNNWLLIKHHDGYAREGDHDALLADNAVSIATGRAMDAIAAGNKVWNSEPKKAAKAAQKTSRTAQKKAAPDFVEPELATLTDAMPQGEDWVHEIKFDGYRTLALISGGEARMMTRSGLDWTAKFQALADRLQALDVTDAILDGEIVAVDHGGATRFKLLQDRLREKRSEELQYYVFDLLRLNGEDLRKTPLIERKAKLKALLGGHDFEDRIIYSEHFEADKRFLGKVCGMGFEGLVSKRKSSPYRGGRNKAWLKTKCHKRQEFVIGGFREPTHAERGIGALLLGYYDEDRFVYAGRVGTGFDAETSQMLRKKLDAITRKTPAYAELAAEAKRGAIWVRPELVCEVEFTEWTPDGRLRHPSYQGLREDKPARSIGREQVTPEAQAVQQETPKPSRRRSQDTEIGGVKISHPDRVLWPDDGFTKQQMAHYYAAVAEHILPHVVGRPLSMVRCPDGIGGQCFFQRHIAHDMPHLYDTGVPVKGRDEDYMMIRDAAGLLTLAQWGVIELHPWGCRADRPDRPDRIVMDFDPDPDLPWAKVAAAAREGRQRLADLGLKSWLKTTGGKGLHVVVPLQRHHDWPTVKAFARAVAEAMEAGNRDLYVAHARKADRKGRIFVDYLRNDLTATAVAAYSLRARPGAPVAMPLDWDDLTDDLNPRDFNLATVPDLLARRKTDPWADLWDAPQNLSADALKAMGVS